MCKGVFILFISLLPFFSTAQQTQGIAFSDAADWQTVIKRAKTENKFIFLDLYATWCAPCKQMDEKVYTDPSVIEIANLNFITIKIQVDTTKMDNDRIKSWHKEVKLWLRDYIDAFPTLLFFSSEGKLLNKFVGYYDSTQFLGILNEVINPDKNYIAQLKKFESGLLNDRQLLELAFLAKQNKDTIAYKIAKVYKERSFDVRVPELLMNPEGLQFLSEFSSLFMLHDTAIKYIYDHSESAEKELGAPKEWVSNYINYLIRRDMFQDVKTPKGVIINNNPNWAQIQTRIEKVLDYHTAKRATLKEQILYYWKRKDWNQQAKYEFEQVEFNGLDTLDDWSMMTVNDMIFDVLVKHVTDKVLLKRAIGYLELILKARPKNYHFLDTYAAVLYKANYRKKALKVELLALKLAKEDKNIDSIREYENMILKIKKKKPLQ